MTHLTGGPPDVEKLLYSPPVQDIVAHMFALNHHTRNPQPIFHLSGFSKKTLGVFQSSKSFPNKIKVSGLSNLFFVSPWPSRSSTCCASTAAPATCCSAPCTWGATWTPWPPWPWPRWRRARACSGDGHGACRGSCWRIG